MAPTLYFAYGSNMSTTQMTQRCPNSMFAGVAALDGWEFFINERGFANIKERPGVANPAVAVAAEIASGRGVPSYPLDPSRAVVYGMLYRLDPADEAKLDICEGAPSVYGKEMVWMRYFPAPQTLPPASTSHRQFSDPDYQGFVPNVQLAQVLAYVDRNNVVPDQPRKEYVARMRRAVHEAAAHGVPVDWMKASIGPCVDVRKELDKINPTITS